MPRLTVTLIAVGMTSQLLATQTQAAPSSGAAVASTDPAAVPRLVRTARIDPAVPGCFMGTTAALSADGHTAILGCIAEGMRVVVLSDAFPGGAWQVTASIDVQQVEPPFGRTLAMSADARTLAIGDHFGERGVWIYTRVGGAWSRTATIDVRDWVSAVVLSGDGQTLALAPRWLNEVRMFRRTSVGWLQLAVISSPVRDSGSFGHAGLALSMTGDTVLVGAPTASGNKGAAFVFRRTGDREWRLLQTLEGPARGGHFGNGVALSADGNTVAVGGGGVSVFRTRPAPGAVAYARTGHFAVDGALALSADGRTLVIGNGERTVHGVYFAGRAHRFVRTDTGWRFGGVLDPSGDDIPYSGNYAEAVAVDATGRRVLVVAPEQWPSPKTLAADLFQRPAASAQGG